MEFWQYGTAAAIVLLAYFIRGIAGFGSGLIAVPLLALFLPLTFVVPLILLLDFTASLVMGGVDFKHVLWKEVGALIPFSILGVIVGTQLLVNLPVTPMLLTLAVFIFIFAIRSLLNLKGEKPVSQWWAIPAALTGGTIGGLFGTGGPPYVIYLNHRIHDKTQLRAAFSALFFIEGASRIITFFVAGLLLAQTIWWNSLGALPLMLGALYLGGRVHTGLSHAQMTRLIGVLLLLASLSLLVKALY
ncbi:MAG TPA: sulfite exporter TauE/SafE family protein [Candidatus Thiothrix moscowensis]|uniref:sulfite exporter TauE/SafE family protein n=1 Tax=unclassified Thiothrix TaxID=2636184 RepID=UPI0025E6A299|nr:MULTISPECIES: sulfite exporter TauE/SafE family protein [unclassified Thiothrix]HRJ54616.1 sulfite exporter TauE/SafE family protein [Candidatus Thiothrix moscowensis]HRJ95012.1 sulfite exporter TauE/SafE family protein [Candidatus Thiothrix moscowensis]